MLCVAVQTQTEYQVRHELCADGVAGFAGRQDACPTMHDVLLHVAAPVNLISVAGRCADIGHVLSEHCRDVVMPCASLSPLHALADTEAECEAAFLVESGLAQAVATKARPYRATTSRGHLRGSLHYCA